MITKQNNEVLLNSNTSGRPVQQGFKSIRIVVQKECMILSVSELNGGGTIYCLKTDAGVSALSELKEPDLQN